MAKTKGTHVISAVKVLRHQREAALQILPPQLHKYLEERILPSSWYPFEEQLELLRAVGKLMAPDGPDETTWQLMGRGTARQDLTGVYKTQLRRGDAEGMMRWMAAMWKNAHDSGEPTVLLEAPGRVRLELRSFDGRSREFCMMTNGYISECVKMSIGQEPEVVHRPCGCRGGGECVWTVSWSA